MADDQQQDTSQDLDPIQQMIQQAIGSQKNQPAPDNYVMASAEPMERPTLGTRIGAKEPAAPIIKTAQPSAPGAPDPTSVLSSTPPATATANLGGAVPAAPVGGNNPNRVALLKQQADLGKPIDKTDPKYKMGWGQRLLGIAANFGSGLNHQGPVAYTGPGATNSRYTRDEATRQGNLANVGTQLEGQEKLDTANLNLEKEAQKQAYETQIGGYRQDLGKAAEQNADTRSQLAQSQAELNIARAGKAGEVKEPQTEPEIALALQTAKIKGDKQGVLKYQGALQELARQKAAGREPRDTSAADIAKALQVAEFRGRETDKVDKAKETERDKRYAELDKNVVLKYNTQKMAEAKAKVDADIETKHAPKYQDINDKADQMLGLTKSGSSLKSDAPVKPAAPSGDRVTGTYMGPDNPQKGLKHGQSVTLPKSQVQQATKLGHFKSN